MFFLQITVALIFMTFMLITNNKWIIAAGCALVFIAGTSLYLIAYSSDFGRIDLGVVFIAAMSSVRNFLFNNDFVAYADKFDTSEFLAATIVCILSAFMAALTAVKIFFSYYSDLLYLLAFGKNKHICIFTDASSNTLHLVRSINGYIENSLCIFINCGRIAELESESNVLFLDEAACRYMKKNEPEVFICSENAESNKMLSEKLRRLLPKSKHYVFAEHCEHAVNREELLVRYLFVATDFVPLKFTENTKAELCILGDNKLAIELCKELIVQCQSIAGIPRITIIGAEAEDSFAFFVKSNPGLKNCAELTFVNVSPTSVEGIAALTGNEYHLCFFCDGNKDLPRLLPNGRAVELPEYSAIYDYNILANFSLDKEAKKLNSEFERNYRTGKDCAIIDEDAAWVNLSEFHRQSNRSQALNIPSKIYLNHHIGIPLEQLAVIEHLRWSAFHYINGWVYGCGVDGRKDIKNKRHPCLVPYDELSQEEKNKNLLFVKKTISKGEANETVESMGC